MADDEGTEFKDLPQRKRTGESKESQGEKKKKTRHDGAAESVQDNEDGKPAALKKASISSPSGKKKKNKDDGEILFDESLEKVSGSTTDNLLPYHNYIYPGDCTECMAFRSRSIYLTPTDRGGQRFLLSLGGSSVLWNAAGMNHLGALLQHYDKFKNQKGKWSSEQGSHKQQEFFSPFVQNSFSFSTKPEKKQSEDEKQAICFLRTFVEEIWEQKTNKKRDPLNGDLCFMLSLVRTLTDHIGKKCTDWKYDHIRRDWNDLWTAYTPLTRSGMFIQLWDGRGTFGNLCFIPYGTLVVIPAYIVHGDGFRSNSNGHPRLSFRLSINRVVTGDQQTETKLGYFYLNSPLLMNTEDMENNDDEYWKMHAIAPNQHTL